MAYKDNSAEARKEKTWIECVDLHLDFLKTQRMVETGRDGTTIAEAHADLYQRGRGLFERFYKEEGDNENIYVHIARGLSSKPLLSPRVAISANDTREVEEHLRTIDLAKAIGHQTGHFPAVIIPKH